MVLMFQGRYHTLAHQKGIKRGFPGLPLCHLFAHQQVVRTVEEMSKPMRHFFCAALRRLKRFSCC